MKRENWPVGDFGVRPAGPPDECIYCGAKVGTPHSIICVIRERSVVVRATIEYTVLVPEYWEASNIEFHRNESSWCVNNMLDELDALPDCLCGRVEFEYVREASPDDETRDGVFVENSES